MSEIIGRRTENSKTFLDGRKYRLESYARVVHYKDNYDSSKEQWKDIDLTFENSKITKAPYTLEVNELTIRLTSKRTGTVQILTLDRIGANPPQRPVTWVFIGNQAIVKNIAPATDLVIEAGANLVRFKRILHNASAPLESIFTHSKVVGKADDIVLIVDARDADGKSLPVVKTDIAGKLTETLDSKVDLTKVKFPIEIDPSPLIVQPSAKDAFIALSTPTTNYGAYGNLQLYDYNVDVRRNILEFDISGLPGGATLDSANLQLYYYQYERLDPSGQTVWAYKLTRTDWVESQATWNIYKTSSSWTSTGGDYVTENPAGSSTTFPASYDWMTWNVLAIIRDAYDSSIDAEFLVKFETETRAYGSDHLGYWWSKEYTDDTTLCPKLTIEFHRKTWAFRRVRQRAQSRARFYPDLSPT